MLSPTLIKYGVLAIGFVVYTGVCYHKGYTDADRKAQLVAGQLREATEKEKNDALVVHNERITRMAAQLAAADANRLASERRINSRLDSVLVGLRDRPERPADLSSDPRPACTGANGPELAREHAGFLARYAARAAQQDADLEACYAKLDAIRAASPSVGASASSR